MSMVQLHLVLNHFPFVGLILAGALLVYALWRGSREARTIALVGIALAGLLVIPVRISGDEAAEVVEHLPGFSETRIDRHEDAADLAGTLAIMTGIAALLVLGLQRWAPGFTRGGALAVVVLVIASAAGVGWAGHLGGVIRHPELATGNLREGQAQSLLNFRTPADGAGSERGNSHDDDDDDDDDKKR